MATEEQGISSNPMRCQTRFSIYSLSMLFIHDIFFKYRKKNVSHIKFSKWNQCVQLLYRGENFGRISPQHWTTFTSTFIRPVQWAGTLQIHFQKPGCEAFLDVQSSNRRYLVTSQETLQACSVTHFIWTSQMFPQEGRRGISSCTVVQRQLHWNAFVDGSLKGMLAQKPFPQWIVGEDCGKVEKGNNDAVEATLAKTSWSQLLVFSRCLTAIAAQTPATASPLSSILVSLFFKEVLPEPGAFVWLAVVGNLLSESRNKISAYLIWLAVAPRLIKICNDRAAVQHVHSCASYLGGCYESSPPTGSPAELRRVSFRGFYPNMGSNSTQLRLWAALQLN